MDQITFTAPDDWHCHFRENEFLSRAVNDTAARFQRALIMPNLKTPLTTVAAAQHYREQILAALTTNAHFTPFMTLYLTESMTAQTIIDAKKSEFIIACKLYPAGATTNSKAGVVDLKKIFPLLAAMQEHNLVLCIHGESIEPGIDVFDREQRFIDTSLRILLKEFPKLRIVLEHISTQYAVDFITAAPSNIAATITAHHLLLNRNAIFQGGIHPHYYRLPILKRQRDQEALIRAAVSGNAKFFLGSDSAPHAKVLKESACGCAGIYTAHAAIELYAKIFDEQNALSKLEAFASHNGARFYNLPLNQNKITLHRESWQIPDTLSFGSQQLVPFLAGETLHWKSTPLR